MLEYQIIMQINAKKKLTVISNILIFLCFIKSKIIGNIKFKFTPPENALAGVIAKFPPRKFISNLKLSSILKLLIKLLLIFMNKKTTNAGIKEPIAGSPLD